jgi:hypothetical protein
LKHFSDSVLRFGRNQLFKLGYQYNNMFDKRSIEVLADEEIEKRIIPGAPKILHMGMRYYYANKNVGLDYGHYNTFDSMLDSDYSVYYFDYDRLQGKFGPEKISDLLREFVFTYNPKYIYYAHWHDIIDHKVWQEILKESGSISIIWLSDDHWRFEETSELCDLFDVIVTTDKNGYAKRIQNGMNNVFLSQWGCNPEIYKESGVEKKYDVSFVGQKYGDREDFCRQLRDNGIDIHTFGRGWGGEDKVSQSRYIKILNQSWISLDLTKSSANDTCQIKARPFEVTGCGSLLLTKENPQLEEYFVPGEEIVTYSDAADAAKKIRELLADKTRLAEIARKGHDRTLENHTYQTRLSDIFKACDSMGKKVQNKNQ